MERICVECGKTFRTKFEDIMCKKCITKIISDATKIDDKDELFYIDPVTPPKMRKKPQIMIDAKAATDAGLSYGEYMARKRKGRMR